MKRFLLLGLVVSLVAVFLLPGAAVAKDKGKGDCKQGGWMELVDADGEPFASQGACVQFAAGGGTPMPPETVLAVAYTNVVDDGGGYDPVVDVLIAKLVDTDGSGTVTVGDTVTTNQYPLDFAATSFGNFQKTSHIVQTVGSLTTKQVYVYADTNERFAFLKYPNAEAYLEDNLSGQTAIVDLTGANLGTDQINITTGTPSDPDTSVANLRRFDYVDEGFINVVITPPVPAPEERVFAVAYTDMDTGDGSYNPAVDVLISKLVDGPGAAYDGQIGPGDLIVTDQYPLGFDFGIDGFGSYTIKQATVTSVDLLTPGAVTVRSASDGNVRQYSWYQDASDESYRDQFVGGTAIGGTDINDHRGDPFTEVLFIDPPGPSGADTAAGESRTDGNTDDPHLDIELTLPLP
jgi:hypothetical protein